MENKAIIYRAYITINNEIYIYYGSSEIKNDRTPDQQLRKRMFEHRSETRRATDEFHKFLKTFLREMKFEIIDVVDARDRYVYENEYIRLSKYYNLKILNEVSAFDLSIVEKKINIFVKDQMKI